MKILVFKSIRSRLTFWFLVMSLLPLIILIIITYIQRVEAAKISSIDKISAIRDLKAEKINRWVDETIGDLHVMSDDFELRALESSFNNELKLLENIEIKEIAEELLNRNKRNSDTYLDIHIINATSGLVEISTNQGEIGANKSTKDYFLTPLETNSVFIENMHKLPNNTAHQVFSIPILCRKHTNHIIGILIAEIDLNNSIYKILKDRVGLGNTGETLIVNKDTITLNELRWYENASLNLKMKSEPAIKAAAGETGVTVTKDYQDEEVLAAYTYLPKMKWGFVSKQDMSEINAPIRKMAGQFAYLFGISVLFIVFIAFVVSNTISKPIVGLDNYSKKIKEGDYSNITKIESQDEIGSLAHSINDMTLSIKSNMIIQNGVKSISNKMFDQVSIHQSSTDILQELIKITESDSAAFYVLNELTYKFEPFTNIGFPKNSINSINSSEGEYDFTEEFLSGNIIHNKAYHKDVLFNSQFFASKDQPNEIIIIPVIVEEVVVAITLIATQKHFSKESIAIVTQSSNNINISYSSLLSSLRVGILADNVLKIYDELEVKTDALTTQNLELLKQKIISTEANKELEAFSYSVSHDLRAPLRHIDGFTKLLNKNIKDKIDEKSQDYFNNIISSTNQMNTLIEDLLVFSRTGRKGIKKTKITMKKIIDEAFKSSSLDIKEKNITVSIDKLEEVSVDPSLFLQVWINLISNAIKFTSKTKNPKIKIGTEKDSEGKTIYFIKDNGVGFDKKYVDKLFGVFQRLHSNTEFPGTGIGLANVKRIINKHGGEIWAEGEINKGATFFIKLINK